MNKCPYFKKDDWCKKMKDICGMIDKKNCGLRDSKTKPVKFTYAKRRAISVPLENVAEIKADGQTVYNREK